MRIIFLLGEHKSHNGANGLCIIDNTDAENYFQFPLLCSKIQLHLKRGKDFYFFLPMVKNKKALTSVTEETSKQR